MTLATQYALLLLAVVATCGLLRTWVTCMDRSARRAEQYVERGR